MESLKKQAAKLLGEQKKYRRWLAVFLCLAIVVTAGTTAALKMNGQALSHKQKVLDCGLEVHEHTAECYESGAIPAEGATSQEEEKPVCGFADYVVHVHNDDCYDGDGELVCQLEQVEPHVHEAGCYTEQMTLICGLEETPGHQHTEECRALICGEAESEAVVGHQHTEACRALICGMEETEGHQHTDSCRSVQNELICESTEEGHEHTDNCYQQTETITCGLEEVQGHTHTDACYDAHACGLEETAPGHVHTENCYDPYACGIEEGAEGHIHTDECWQAEQIFTCGKLELHTHVTEGEGSCYDAEGNLICEIPELKEHVHGEDCFVTAELTKEEVEAMQGGEDTAESEDAEESTVERTVYQKSFENEFIKIVAEYDETAGIPVEAELFIEQISGTAEETDIDGVTNTSVTTESTPEDGESAEGDEADPSTDKDAIDAEPEAAESADTNTGNDSDAGADLNADTGVENVQGTEPNAETDTDETPVSMEDGTLHPTSEDVTMPGSDTGEDTQPVTGSESDTAQAGENSGSPDAAQDGDDASAPSENAEDTEVPLENVDDMLLQGKGRMEIVPEEVTYKIGFRLNGEEIEPQGSVTFTVWNLEEEGSEPQTLVCSGEEGSGGRNVTLTRMVEVLVQTEFHKEYEDGSIRVIAEYEKSANIPEEAELRVSEITLESDPERFTDCEGKFREAVEDEDAEMSALLDIGFYVDGIEVEPEDTVTMIVQFLDGEGQPNGDPINVVHFAENKTEVLEESNTDEEGYVIFKTDSFSPFAFFQTAGTVGIGPRSSVHGIPVYVSRNGEWEIVGGVEEWDFFGTDSESNFINPYTCVESLRLYSQTDSEKLRNSAQNSENGIAPEKWIGYSTSSEIGKGITTVDCKVITFDNYDSWETSPVWIFGDVRNDIKAIYYLPGNMTEYENADVPATLFSGDGYKVIFNPGNVGSDKPLTSYGSIAPVTVNIPVSAVDAEGFASIRLPADSKLGEPFSFTENSEWQYTIGRESGYDYELVGWYNITDKTYYSVKNTGNGYKEVRIKVAEGSESRKVQFYGDWIAASYDVPDGRKAAAVNDTDGGKTEDISDFVSTRVFDYNELFNIYSAYFIEDGNTWELYPQGKFHQDKKMTAGSLNSEEGHTLELEEMGDRLGFPFIQAIPDQNKNALIHPSLMDEHAHTHNTDKGVQGIAGTNKQDNILLQYLFPDEESLDGALGVHYVGEGNYLYRHFGSDEEHIGYYEFNSDDNTALYDRKDQRFYILPGEPALSGRAFLPFNYGGGLTTDSPNVNYHFGICSEIDFYLPSKPGTQYTDSQGNVKYGNLIDEDIAAGKDGRMLFEFSGDDDVWVFVDDILILDLGGIHGKISGSIDFSTGTVTDSNGTNSGKSDLLKSVEAGNHKLTIYYLERGGGESNCRIKFNIVPRYKLELPTANTVTVKKVWEDLGNDIKHDKDSVTVGLYTKKDDALVGEKEVLNKDNNWSHTWEALAPDKEYIVKEDPVDGYKSSSKVKATSEYMYWAETDDLWDEKATDDERTIVILNRDNDAKALSADGSVKNITVTQGVIVSELTDDIKWEVIPAEGGYYLRNKESKNYLCIDGNGVSISGSPQAFNLDSDAKIRLCTNDYKLVYADGGFHSYAKSGNNETNSPAENIAVRVFRYHAVSSFVKNYTITNTYLPEIAIWKVDSETEAELGATTFTLTRTYEEKITEEIKDKDGNLQNIEKLVYKWGYYTENREWVDNKAETLEQAKENAAKVQAEITFSGKLRLEKLSDGDYILTEKKAPDGYLLQEGELAKIEFSVEGGQITKVSQNLIGQKVSGENASEPKKIAEIKEDTNNKILLVRNEKLPVTTVRIRLLKYSKGPNSSTALGGASFNLYKVLTEDEIREAESNNETLITIKPDSTELKVKLITDNMKPESVSNEGLFFDGALPCGTYYLEETKPPVGYNVIVGMVKFEIKDVKGTISVMTEDNSKDIISSPDSGTDGKGSYFEIKIFNTQGFALPETGSLGTKPFTIGGALLITATAILMYGYSVRRKKSERRLKK